MTNGFFCEGDDPIMADVDSGNPIIPNGIVPADKQEGELSKPIGRIMASNVGQY